MFGRFSAVLLCLAEDVIFGVGFSRVFVKQVWIPLLARREFAALHNVVNNALRDALLVLFLVSQADLIINTNTAICLAAVDPGSLYLAT